VTVAGLRVVVVGGTGYVGGRVAIHLRDEGADVVVTGRSVDPDGILPTEPVDLSNDPERRLDDVVRGADAVVSCVAMSEQGARDEPERAAQLAVLTSTRLAQTASRLGVRRLLQLSTVRVYGVPVGEVDETYPLAPVNPTAVAHAHGERALADAVGPNVSWGLLRLSNAVGPPLSPRVRRWDVLTNELARSWATHGRMVLRSSGRQHRDFVPIEDVARAVSHLLFSPEPPPRVVNLSAGRSRRVVDVGARMAELAAQIGGVSPLFLHPAPAAEEPEERPFRFANDRLRATGFEFLDRFDAELEGTLRFAWRHFAGQPA
jgi:UDP-glucose 4-epimerase